MELPKTVRRRAAARLWSSPRGAPRDACVAGTPLRGPITTVFGYGSRLSARFARVGRDDDPFRRSFIRTKNQPSRVVGSPPLFPACYLQGSVLARSLIFLHFRARSFTFVRVLSR